MRIYIQYVTLLACLWSTWTFAREAVPVVVTEARVSPVIENIPLSGTVTSARSSSLSTRVSGLVKNINVDAGDRVNEGDILIELDADLARLEQNRSLAVLNEARIALTEAKRLRDEAVNLAKNKNIPETTVQARAAEVELKTAELATTEAEYKQQAEIVKRHVVTAPFTGVISEKLTEVGEWIQTGTPVLSLVAIDQLRLDVQAPQEYFHLINQNTPVEVKLDAMPGRLFTGKVSTTVPVNNPNARTFLVRVQIDNAREIIIPGMSARASFTITFDQEALLLARDAIVQHPDGRNSVWVVKNIDGTFYAYEKQVQLGRSTSTAVIIRQGLQSGELVVIRGNETLQENQAVKILEPADAVMK